MRGLQKLELVFGGAKSAFGKLADRKDLLWLEDDFRFLLFFLRALKVEGTEIVVVAHRNLILEHWVNSEYL